MIGGVTSTPTLTLTWGSQQVHGCLRPICNALRVSVMLLCQWIVLHKVACIAFPLQKLVAGTSRIDFEMG